MSVVHQSIIARFAALADEAQRMPLHENGDHQYADAKAFYAWAMSALNAIQGVFGKESPQYEQLNSEVKRIYNHYISRTQLEACCGIFLGAKSDVEGGFIFRLQAQLSGEVLGDFVSAAKQAQAEGHIDVAAVLACAALEDALKRFASMNDLDVSNKTMDAVVNALKSKGLIGGAQKVLVSAMPRIRNSAMHADWDELKQEDVGSVIGFVEQFLLKHF